jgi:hypothetical protein
MTTQQTANPQAENVPPQGLAPSLAKDQHGNTLVEMAIVLPCFFLLLFGLFQFAQICYGYNAANYAARQLPDLLLFCHLQRYPNPWQYRYSRGWIAILHQPSVLEGQWQLHHPDRHRYPHDHPLGFCNRMRCSAS